jgi:hypothetical protein
MLDILVKRALESKLDNLIPGIVWVVPIAMICAGLLLVWRSMGADTDARTPPVSAAAGVSKSARLRVGPGDVDAAHLAIGRRLARLESRLARAEATVAASMYQALVRAPEREILGDTLLADTLADLLRPSPIDVSHGQWSPDWKISPLIERELYPG